jgi:hypothetical protein
VGKSPECLSQNRPRTSRAKTTILAFLANEPGANESHRPHFGEIASALGERWALARRFFRGHSLLAAKEPLG